MKQTATQKTVIKKAISAKGRYLLGKDADGISYWLTPASWDCNWYWGFGYVHTKDSHTHIDTSYMGKIEFYNTTKKMWDRTDYIHNIFDCPVFTETTFNEAEGWVLSELFCTFYTLKKTAELYHTGGAHITTNPLNSILKNKEQEDYINKVLLPKVFDEIYKILSPA